MIRSVIIPDTFVVYSRYFGFRRYDIRLREDVEEWCIENTSGHVARIRSRVYDYKQSDYKIVFQSSKDAALFRLRWSSDLDLLT